MTAKEILDQIGYYRTDRLFVSLNLTGHQFTILQMAEAYSGCKTVEETVTAACEALIVAKSLENAYQDER
jgi:hypothetical protein